MIFIFYQFYDSDENLPNPKSGITGLKSVSFCAPGNAFSGYI